MLREMIWYWKLNQVDERDLFHKVETLTALRQVTETWLQKWSPTEVSGIIGRYDAGILRAFLGAFLTVLPYHCLKKSRRFCSFQNLLSYCIGL